MPDPHPPHPPEAAAAAPPRYHVPRRATAGFAFSHPFHALALGFGAGLSPVAPGTVGTLWAWVAFRVAVDAQAALPWDWILLVGTLVGVWACTVTAQHLGQSDPSSIVWDEIIAFWLVLWVLMPTGFLGQLVAFALFRFFDAAKPNPVDWADQVFKSTDGRIGWRQGLGIMLDDLVAAGCTLLVIALWRAFFG